MKRANQHRLIIITQLIIICILILVVFNFSKPTYVTILEDVDEEYVERISYIFEKEQIIYLLQNKNFKVRPEQMIQAYESLLNTELDTTSILKVSSLNSYKYLKEIDRQELLEIAMSDAIEEAVVAFDWIEDVTIKLSVASEYDNHLKTKSQVLVIVTFKNSENILDSDIEILENYILSFVENLDKENMYIVDVFGNHINN